MARHGENIRKRNDGRWEARYQIFDADKGRKIYRSVYGSTYEEAKGKREAAVRLAEKKTNPAKGHAACRKEPRMQILFSRAADEWLEEVSDKHKHSTYIKYKNIYKNHLERAAGSYLLSAGSAQELKEKISDHLSEKDLSGSIRRSICCVWKQILEFAGRKYSIYIPVLKLAAVKPARKPVAAFTKAEQSRLLAHIYGSQDKFATALLLCLYTGVRLGELCALKWTDFDQGYTAVTVNRTVQRIAVEGCMTKTALIETDPKSGCSRRTIPLASEITKLLKRFRENQPYVFGGARPLEPRTMQYRFKRILEKTGIDGRNFHILRHTFATNCVESGMDAKTLSELLGHSDVKITLNRYVHPTMDSKRRQIGRLPDFYGQIRGQAA